MFGGKDRRERAIKQLAEAVNEAAAAVEGDARPDLEMVLERLSDALLHAPDNPMVIGRFDPELDNLLRRGRELRTRLSSELGELREHDLARRLTACPRCGGREIFVSDQASIEGLVVGTGSMSVPFTMAVCRACGDIRMTMSDPGALAAARNASGTRGFRLVVVDTGDKSPYR